MTLQHKIFQSRINGLKKLNEQIPVGGGGNFGASNALPQLPRISGDFGGRDPRQPSIANTISGLYRSGGSNEPYEFNISRVTAGWQKSFDAWVAGGMQGEAPFPPEFGNEYDNMNPWDMSPNGGNSYWASFWYWFLGDMSGGSTLMTLLNNIGGLGQVEHHGMSDMQWNLFQAIVDNWNNGTIVAGNYLALLTNLMFEGQYCNFAGQCHPVDNPQWLAMGALFRSLLGLPDPVVVGDIPPYLQDILDEYGIDWADVWNLPPSDMTDQLGHQWVCMVMVN
mgnify:FL=1